MQDTGAATPPVRLFRKILPVSRGDFPQETPHELDWRSGAQLPSHVHFCIHGTGSCHCHRVQVPEFRGDAVSGGGRYSGAAAPRTGQGGKAAGWRGCRGEAGKRRPGSARLPQGRAPARGKRFRRGDRDTSVGSLDTFYTESTRISVHRRKRFFRTVKNPAIITLGSRKKPKAFELQQSFPASPCGGFRNCIPCVRPNMPEAPSGRPACGQKKSGAVPPPRRAAMRPTLPSPCSRTRSRGRASTLCTGCRRHRCRPCAAPAGSPLSP